jgi:protein N-terminal methyltransferase
MKNEEKESSEEPKEPVFKMRTSMRLRKKPQFVMREANEQ